MEKRDLTPKEIKQLVYVQTICRGLFVGGATYIVTCVIARQTLRLERFYACMAVGIFVNATTLAAAYWLGRIFRVRSQLRQLIAPVIALASYAVIFVIAIILAFVAPPFLPHHSN
jgi:hypothetical protein